MMIRQFMTFENYQSSKVMQCAHLSTSHVHIMCSQPILINTGAHHEHSLQNKMTRCYCNFLGLQYVVANLKCTRLIITRIWCLNENRGQLRLPILNCNQVNESMAFCFCFIPISSVDFSDILNKFAITLPTCMILPTA
jgi:hypothetical protein